MKNRELENGQVRLGIVSEQYNSTVRNFTEIEVHNFEPIRNNYILMQDSQKQ